MINHQIEFISKQGELLKGRVVDYGRDGVIVALADGRSLGVPQQLINHNILSIRVGDDKDSFN